MPLGHVLPTPISIWILASRIIFLELSFSCPSNPKLRPLIDDISQLKTSISGQLERTSPSQLNRLSYYPYQELQQSILYPASLEKFDSKLGFCPDFQPPLFPMIKSPRLTSHRDPFCLQLIILFSIYVQPYFSSISMSLSNSAFTTCITKSDCYYYYCCYFYF